MIEMKEIHKTFEKLICRIKKCMYRQAINPTYLTEIGMPEQEMRWACRFCSSSICKCNETYQRTFN